MRIGKSGWFFFAVLTLLAWHYAPRAFSVVAPSFVESAQDRSIYYRLLAKYQHGEEIIDFDIVVGCGVRVTRWGDGDKSYDAFRDPVAYAKATKDGSAVLQMVPSACRGETSEKGDVPDDFLPGVLWFDRADDLSFGIAYITEDAFDSPQSQLKFLGASIHAATRTDWLAFEPIAIENLIDPRPLFALVPLPDAEEIKRHLGDSRALGKLWLGMDCNAVTRFHLSDPAERAILRKYWPASKPRYWLPSKETLDHINDEIHLWNQMQVDGRPVSAYFRLGHHVANGFPTPSQGGLLGSRHRSWDLLPPTIFPLRQDDGIPWIAKDYLTATALYRDIDLLDGAKQGFAYCYAQIPGESLGVPAYENGAFITRVDGESISGESLDDRVARNRPWPFFERDEYFYVKDNFGLN